MKVINIFGGPGVGKSTLSAELFVDLKKSNLSIEYATEYAKDMIYEYRDNILNDQIYIFAKQNRKLKRLENHVDTVITDSPILLSAMYEDKGIVYYDYFVNLVLSVFNTYDNTNFFLERNVPYKSEGRYQSYEEALKIDNHIKNTLDEFCVKYKVVKDKNEILNNLFGKNNDNGK